MKMVLKLFIISVVLWLSCVTLEEPGPWNNVFDPNGENWIGDQLPIIKGDFTEFPKWVSFDSKTNTGTVAHPVEVKDPDWPNDSVIVILKLKDGEDLIPVKTTLLEDVLLIHNLLPGKTYSYIFTVRDTHSLSADTKFIKGKVDTLFGTFTTSAQTPPEISDIYVDNSNGYGIKFKFLVQEGTNIKIFMSENYKTGYSCVFEKEFLQDDSVNYEVFPPSFKPHYFYIEFINEFGKNTSDTIAISKVNPSLPVPPQPDWSGDTLEDRININVKYSIINGLKYLYVFRSSKPNFGYKIVGTVDVNQTSIFTDTTLPAPGIYYYKTAYYTTEGTSMFSEYVIAQTKMILVNNVNVQSNVYKDKIPIYWDAAQGAEVYKIYRNIYNSLDTVLVAEVPSTSTFYTDSVVLDTGYYYFVSAVKDGIEGMLSFPVYGNALRIPQDVKVDTINTTDSMISITFLYPFAGFSFIIYRSPDSLNFTPIDTIIDYNSNIISFFDTSALLTVDNPYYYITAFKNNVSLEESRPSNKIKAGFAPEKVDSVYVEPLPDKIHLYWNKSQKAEKYLVYRSSSYYELQYFTEVQDTELIVTDSIDTLMYYRIIPANKYGKTPTSKCKIVSAKKLSVPGDGFISVASTSVGADIILGGFENADGYYLYISIDSLTNYTVLDTFFNTEITIPLDSNKYYFKVRAYNLAGVSNFSNIGSAKRLVPNKVGTIWATDGDGTVADDMIRISWDSVEGADGYKIYRTTQSPTNINNFTLIGSISSKFTEYKDPVLTDSIYYYRVKAFNIVGDGVISDFDEGFRNPLTTPDSVRNLVASTGISSYIRLTWQAPDTGANWNGFIVFRSLNTVNPTFNPIDTVDRTEFSYYDYDVKVTAPDSVAYTVATYNIKGKGKFSKIVYGKKGGY